MNDFEIKNAVIKGVKFDNGYVLIGLMLDYGDSGQGFGERLLYASEGWKAHNGGDKYARHFIWRCIEIAGVNARAKLAGRPIRVKVDHNGVKAIGHIIDDKWFDPEAEFTAMVERQKAAELGIWKKKIEQVGEQLAKAESEGDKFRALAEFNYQGFGEAIKELNSISKERLKLKAERDQFRFEAENEKAKVDLFYSANKNLAVQNAALRHEVVHVKRNLGKAAALLIEVLSHGLRLTINDDDCDLTKRIRTFVNGGQL